MTKLSRIPELLDNPFVKLPLHDNTPDYQDRIIAPLGELATKFAEYFSNGKTYPNACMHLAPFPSDQFENRITFMLAWGKQVDRLPHPRDEMLPEYFGRVALAAMRFRKKIYTKHIMDGYGILGKVRVNFLNDVELGVYMGASHNSREVVEKWYPQMFDIGDTVLDVYSELMANSPLRFHSGIRYVPRNGYISNEFFPDDQQSAIPLAA